MLRTRFPRIALGLSLLVTSLAVAGAGGGCGGADLTSPSSSAAGSTGSAQGGASNASGNANGSGGSGAQAAGGSGSASGGAGGGDATCTSNDDCKSPAAPVCDPESGECVQCTPEDDPCPLGQYCDGNECKIGCNDDSDCKTGGGGPAQVCDENTHLCIGCESDDHCPAGSICSEGACVPGCTEQHGCQAGFECCAGECFDTKSDVLHCGSCDPCPAPPEAHADPVCNAGVCGFGPCQPGYDDCNGDPSDGCEADLGGAQGCPCVPGSIAPCYTGPVGTQGKGICKGGQKTCLPSGVGYGECEGEVLPGAESCLTPEDEDCDGEVNEEGEGCVCKPNQKGSCYSGPEETKNVGECKEGVRYCNPEGTAWGPCQDEVLPSEETCAKPGDEDCDGLVNEDGALCACEPGSTISCYGGPVGTAGVGPCKSGVQVCNDDGTGYGPCEDQVVPSQETCLSPEDEDCDGKVNEEGPGCLCEPGSKAPCYTGPNGTEGVGACKAGQKTCNPFGTAYGACVGDVTPKTETCNTPEDDDCDGLVNESGAGCVCVPGTTAPCYTGPAGTEGVGECKAGQKECNPLGTGYGPCTGDVTPKSETCELPGDEDCDGKANEEGIGCKCAPGSTTSCYTGPLGTEGVGACKAGVATCNAQGTDYGPCMGEVLPTIETCFTLEDDDCDGQTNESGQGCVCQPFSTQPCYSGPQGTLNVGQCKAGVQTCSQSGTEWGPCIGEVLPAVESCITPEDDDCNGSNLVCNGVADECSPNTGKCENACSPDMLGQTYVGCVYYPVVTANLVNSGYFDFAVAVSNTGAKPASITVTKGANTILNGTVQPNSVQIYTLPWDSTLKGPSSNSVVPMPGSARVNQGAYKLTSNRPVTVYQYNPLQYTKNGQFSYTNDASLLLPVNAWTGNYRVVSRHHFAGGSGFLSVVAQADNTVVTLSKGPQTGQVKSGIAGIATDGTGTVTLNAGDVIQVVTNGSTNLNDPNDVTGTLVQASKPVQVIGGHQCIYIPYDVGYCDHLEESMPPIETLSKEYFVTAPLIPTGGQPKAQMVRIIATQPNTQITYDPPQPGAPTSIAQAGGWVELQQTVNSFKISANFKILVAQYMLGQAAGGNSGDPAMALAVAIDQYRKDYLFHAPTNYEKNYVNITAPNGVTVKLDGNNVAGFQPIGATGYSIARVQLPNVNGGNHTVIADQPVGISVYGYGQYTSYWYPGGLDLVPIPGQ